MTIDRGAYIDRECIIEGAKEGPLKGFTFVAKDLYDIKGYKTGFGNPTWLETHPPATNTAPPVQALLDAGAKLVGKTHLDELAYSLNGENFHYGTPINPAAPDRIPGGSSSGSVVAVAEGSADIGIGSDTGGSVRVPGSYCGVLGLRPTHGRVSMEHAAALAKSFDTGGFFARNMDLLQAAADVLLATGEGSPKDVKFGRLLIGEDPLELDNPDVKESFLKVLDDAKEGIQQIIGAPKRIKIATLDGLSSLQEWWNVFRICQGADAWEANGEWITANSPVFGPAPKARFEAASRLQPEEIAEGRRARERIVKHMAELLGEDGVLIYPTTPGPAPLRETPPAEMEDFRNRTLSVCCIAGLAGLPQVTLPVLTSEGAPVGVSLVGPRFSDEALLKLAAKLLPVLKPQ